MPQRFVILSLPRTGSTMLTERMDSHPEIICYPSPFTRFNIVVPDPARMAKLEPVLERWPEREIRAAQYEDYIDALIACDTSAPVIGFKQHLSGPKNVSLGLLADQRYKIIYLRRSNMLASYSSAKIAKQYGGKRVYPGSVVETGRIDFDADQFDLFVRWREGQDRRWAPLAAEAGGLVTDYARARSRQGADEIWNFLGVDPALGGEPQIQKKNGDDILSRFTNPGVALAWISRNGHAEWLEPEFN